MSDTTDNIQDPAVDSSIESSEDAVENDTLPEPPRKHKLKIDGEELEVDEEELKRGYSTQSAAQRRMREAAEERKKANDIVSTLGRDTKAALKAAGVDPYEFAKKILSEELEDSLLSDEDKELRDFRKEKTEREESKKAAEAEKEAARNAVERSQAAEFIESEIVEAVQASGMKPTPKLLARIAEYLIASFDADGNRGLKAGDALKSVQKDYLDEVQDHLEAMDASEIESKYPGLFSKIVKYSVAKHSAKAPSFKAGQDPKPEVTSDAPRRRRSLDDILV